MNKENILRVADAIEKGELVKRGIGFNMDKICGEATPHTPDRIDGCGTVACIAGWAHAVRYPKRRLETLRRNGDISYFRPAEATDTWRSAQRYFGLDDFDAERLFMSDCSPSLSDITPAHAVAVLRHLAETGEVDWSVGAP